MKKYQARWVQANGKSTFKGHTLADGEGSLEAWTTFLTAMEAYSDCKVEEEHVTSIISRDLTAAVYGPNLCSYIGVVVSKDNVDGRTFGISIPGIKDEFVDDPLASVSTVDETVRAAVVAAFNTFSGRTTTLVSSSVAKSRYR